MALLPFCPPAWSLRSEGRRCDLRNRLPDVREPHVQGKLHGCLARAWCRARWGEPREAVDIHRHLHKLPHDLRVIDADPELARALRIRDGLRRRARTLSHALDHLRRVRLIKEMARLLAVDLRTVD